MIWSTPAFAESSAFMPPAVTAIGRHYDILYGFLIAISFISCVLVIGGFVYFAFKYKSDHSMPATNICIVMEYIRGGTVEEARRNGSLSE